MKGADRIVALPVSTFAGRQMARPRGYMRMPAGQRPRDEMERPVPLIGHWAMASARVFGLGCVVALVATPAGFIDGPLAMAYQLAW